MAKTARKSSKKNAAAVNDDLQFNMTASVAIEHLSENALPGSELEAIFAGLDDDGEIIELPNEFEVDEKHPTELELLAAVGDANQEESLAEVYAEQDAAAAPASAADVPSAKSAEKPVKEKKAKAPKEPRLTYVIAKKSEIVASRVPGGIVLEVADAGLDAAELSAKQAEFLASIDAMPKKVGEKAVQFFSDFSKYKGVADVKNEVMRRAIALLIKEGELTSGDKGNLQADLQSKPYSIGTARSQSTQCFALFPMLKMTVRDKGRMIANPDSLLMMVMRGEA